MRCAQGLAASSANAYDVGVVPTPAIAYLCSKEDFVAGGDDLSQS